MLGSIEQEKETLVAEVEPLRELKTGIEEITGTGKTVLPGVVAIKKKKSGDGQGTSESIHRKPR